MKVLETKMVEIARINIGAFRIRNESGRAVELVGSLRSTGQLHPVIGRPASHDRYDLICGHIRVRAQKLAGNSKVEMKIVECEDRDAWITAVGENMARTDMSPAEKEGAVALMESLGWKSQREMALTIGIDPSYASRLLSAHEFRTKYKIGHEVNTRTINDSEVIDAPHVRVVLLKMVEAGEVAPSRVRHISQSLAEKKAVLSKLDDLGIRTFILAPKQGFRDSDGTASSEKTNYALTRIFERFVEAIDAEPDPAERARIAQLGVNFLSQYTRPAGTVSREDDDA